MRHIQIFKATFVILFMFLLILPVIQMLTCWFPISPLTENRVLAPLPQLWEIRDPPRFIEKIQHWFQDHYGFRSFLVRLKTQIDFSLFGVSDRVYIGTNGWLFYRSVIDVQDKEIAKLSDSDLNQINDKIARLRDKLAERGIRLIVITNELKHRFYGEHLPKALRDYAEIETFDRFKKKLSDLPGIQYVDTTPILENLMKQRPIFHKTDFHWNDPAGFEVARRLANIIAGDESLPPVWRHPLSIETKDFSGGQANFLPLFRPPHEQGLFVAQSWPNRPFQFESNVGPFEWVQKRHASGEMPLLQTTVVFGDSFFDAMFRAGLPEYFEEIDRARIFHTNISAILSSMPDKTRFFVLQFIETELISLAAEKDNPLD